VTSLLRPVLVLWDIDRTLLFAGGVDKQVWRDTCEQLTGRQPRDLGTTSGRTDPEILLHALQESGVDEREAKRLVPDALRLEADLLAERVDQLRAHGHALPGAVAALAAVAATPNTTQTVLTGNVRRNAELKLAAFGLDHHLDLRIGAFGSDNAHRPTLVQIARKRASDVLAVDFRDRDVVVVGDSLRDVAAAHVNGARMIAVGTGRTSLDALTEAGADITLATLADTDAVVTAIVG
jgi:phosphoglycolate phosphatase-like HAD superfamily hydrolase